MQDPVSGLGVFDTTVPLNVLSPGGLWRTSVLFGTGTIAPGNYPLTLGLDFGGALACQAQAALPVQSGVTPTGTLTGSVAVTPTTIVQGQGASIGYQIGNIGNSNLPGLNIEILVVNLANQSIVQTLADQIDLGLGNSIAKTLPLSTSAITAGDYFAVLRGGQDSNLITLGGANPKVGTHLTYTLTVTNNGPDTASGVALTDSLPTSMSFVSATPSQGSCSGTGTVTCQMGELAKDGSATVSIVVNASCVVTLDNNAKATANESDPNPSNNSDTATVTVGDPSPPLVAATLTPSAPNGDNGWYISNVSVKWNVSDPESGALLLQKAGCVDQLVSIDIAGVSFSCQATSLGGTTGPVSTPAIKLDTGKPVIDAHANVTNADATSSVGAPVAYLLPNVTDATSGPANPTASCVPAPGSNFPLGNTTVTCNANDLAGNAAVSTQFTVTVRNRTQVCDDDRSDSERTHETERQRGEVRHSSHQHKDDCFNDVCASTRNKTEDNQKNGKSKSFKGAMSECEAEGKEEKGRTED